MYIRKSRSLGKCLDDLRKLHALPPYDQPSNYVAHDGYFANSIREKYSKATIDRARAQLKLNDH